MNERQAVGQNQDLLPRANIYTSTLVNLPHRSLLILLALTLARATCYSAPAPFLPEEAKKHVRQDASGLVEQVSFSSKGHAFLNFGGGTRSTPSPDSSGHGWPCADQSRGCEARRIILKQDHSAADSPSPRTGARAYFQSLNCIDFRNQSGVRLIMYGRHSPRRAELHDPTRFQKAEPLKNKRPPKFKLPIRGASSPSLAGNLQLGGPV